MGFGWKRFSEITPRLRELYLASVNARLAHILTDPGKNETGRFWEAAEMIEKEAKHLRECLDGQSRSKIWLFLQTMKKVGMLKDEDAAGFSERMRNALFGDRFEKR